MVQYSAKFRSKMVGKMTAPGGRIANALSAEVGVAQGTLSRWLREAGRVAGMKSERSSSARPHSKQRSAQVKLRLIIEAAGRPLTGVGLSFFILRSATNREHRPGSVPIGIRVRDRRNPHSVPTWLHSELDGHGRTASLATVDGINAFVALLLLGKPNPP